MINKMKFVPLFLLFLFAPLGCGEEGAASIDVLKNRITSHVQNMIGKGDIAIQKYENKIRDVRDNLIKVKVSKKTFEQKLERKKTSLASMEKSGTSPEKIALVTNTVQDMENFLQQIQTAETKLEGSLKKLVENLDLVKIKVAALEAKRDMLDAMRGIQDYTSIGENIDDLGGNIDNTIEEMQKEVYAIEAEIEIENLLTQVKEL
ncbi:hypothetical protein [Candidatus Parabeggiatoa sp. HSG14]|uniref:PspA/IM30 family protein n=1 Tax=Candidatus Parabeggiatoa sp. HSG14 TaxID=3055593 RepID=UPI0025A71F76|nr:hypothetical protein [Thiotrichales bacterium HSG14]